MADEVGALLAAGQGALGVGDWRSAAESFRAAIAVEETPEALLGLASAICWQGDLLGAIERLERAYAGFRRRPEPMYAAACAIRLAFHYHSHLANQAAAAGWLARATRIVDESAIDPLRGELLLARASVADDPVAAEPWAREVLDISRRAGDLDLELCGLSLLGSVLVAQGKISEGVALLDEAMAGCLGGEARMLDTVAYACCMAMRWCTRCADFERAVQWVAATTRIAERYGSALLYTECRTAYARIFFATGQWRQAEETARSAIELSRDAMHGFHADALATLAELRVAQGRVEEAERLLAGTEGLASSLPVLVRIHLLRGRSGLAASAAQRRLDLVDGGQMERAVLLELLGEVEIARGDHGAAGQHARALAELGAALGCQMVVARAHRLRGCALVAADPAAARRDLDLALTAFVRLGMPYEAGRTRHLIAAALRDAEPEAAEQEARAALAAFEELGAARDADEAAAFLRELGVKAARGGPRSQEVLTRREREVLVLLGEGLSNPEIARRLFVSRKTVEHHVAHVLAKLGLRSRAEAAAEAVRRSAERSGEKSGAG